MKRDEIWEAAGFQRNPSNFKQNFQLYRFKIHFACFSITGDCKDGIDCKSTFSPHFKRYSHALLATTRSCGSFENTNKEKTNESVSQFYLYLLLYFPCPFHQSLIIFFPCGFFLSSVCNKTKRISLNNWVDLLGLGVQHGTNMIAFSLSASRVTNMVG